MLVETWRVSLLGELKAEQVNSTIARFRTRKAASLFAFLACHLHRAHSREELADRFWPDDAPDTARTKLRLALASLRRQFEPLGVQSGTVLVADRTHLRLSPEAVETDVAAFEADLNEAQTREAQTRDAQTKEARQDTNAAGRIRLLTRAVHRYGGDLLPGDYEEWVLLERERLRHRYLDALTQLMVLTTAQNDLNAAIAFAHRLLQADPLQEDVHVALMRLYIQTGRAHDASQQYNDLTDCLKQGFDSLPGTEAQALAATLPVIQRHKNAATQKGAKKSSSAKKSAEQSRDHAQSAMPSAAPPSDPALPKQTMDFASSTVSNPEQTPVSSTSGGTLSYDLRLPIFLTRCFGRYETVRALAAMLDTDIAARFKAEQNAHYHLRAEGKAETFRFSEEDTNDNAVPTRLVTLTGLGGAGKTRLAVETARFLQPIVPYPIAFIGLAEVTDADHILRHIANALHLPQTSSSDPLTLISARLESNPVLLIFDNFEQLIPGGVSIIQTLLTRLPALCCLVTSRQQLGLPGERVFPVQPLPVTASQQLFLDRAQATRPDFQITANNAQSVATLCQQLEGIPLAVELAASWIGVLTPAQMLARMNRRFDLLISRKEDRVLRHRALNATIAWSCELLSPELHTFLARLSVFRGGWTEQAANAVGGVSHALHMLAQLRERSLVVSQETDNGATMRFRMLESIREYADTRLDVVTRQEVRQIHATHFLLLAEEAERNITGPDQAYWFACLEPEQPNIRAALDWQAGEPEALEAQLRLTVAMRVFWRTLGHLAESRQYLEAVLAREGVEVYGSAYGLALVEVGLIASMKGDQDTARAYARRALEIARIDNNPALAASAYNTLGNAAKRLREYEAARDLYTQCLTISREISDRRMEATAVANLGNIAQEQSEFAQAAGCYQESLAVYRKLQNKQGLVIQLYNLASLNVQTDDYARAVPFLVECLMLCQEISDTPTIMHALEVFGFIADEFAQPTRAVELYAAASRLRKHLGLPMSPRGQEYMEEVLMASRSQVGSEEFARLWQAGTEAPLEQTIILAGQVAVPAEATALEKAG